MSAKPMFMFAGVYSDRAAAEADFSEVKALHSAKKIGSYDALVVDKRADGALHVSKTEKPTQHGAALGLVAGLVVGLVIRAGIIGIALAGASGAAAGALIAHLSRGTSRAEVAEIGAMLQPGDSALVVVGVDRDAETVKAAANGSQDHLIRLLSPDGARGRTPSPDGERARTAAEPSPVTDPGMPSLGAS